MKQSWCSKPQLCFGGLTTSKDTYTAPEHESKRKILVIFLNYAKMKKAKMVLFKYSSE